MSRLIPIVGVLAVAALGCRAPARQPLSAAPSLFGVSVNSSSPVAGNATGLSSPVLLTLRVADLGAVGGTVDSGAVALRNTQGSVLAQASLPGGAVIPKGGVGKVSVTLEWAAASGIGRRLDWRLSVRDGRGTLHALSDTVAY